MSDKRKLEPLPRFGTDEEAERFVDEADLSEYDLSGFKPARFEFERKSARVNMRVPAALLDAVKSPARNVLCIFNELEGCPRQETSRRRCWSIVEGR